MALFLGIDLGTSYFKAGLFDASGSLKGLGRVPTPVRSLPGGRAEIEVDDFWRALRQCVDDAFASIPGRREELCGISYSSQANTFIALDAQDRPLTPLIVWTDQRAAPLDPALAAFARSDAFLQTAGFSGLSPQFAFVKWRAMRRQRPDFALSGVRLLTLSDYLVWQLTGVRAGDSSTAALTGAWDVRAAQWWDDALRVFELLPEQLAAPVRPGTLLGRTRDSRQLLGLGEGIPVGAGSLDHYAAAIGAGIGRRGPVTISIGTVLASVQVGACDPKPGCYLGPGWRNDEYYQLSFSTPGATAVAEFRERNAAEISYEELLQGAQAAPRRDPRFAELRQIIERLAGDHARMLRTLGGGSIRGPIVATGGGSRSRHWLQLIEGVVGVPVLPPGTQEVACLGAAMFAAAAGGHFRDVAHAADAMCHESEARDS